MPRYKNPFQFFNPFPIVKYDESFRRSNIPFRPSSKTIRFVINENIGTRPNSKLRRRLELPRLASATPQILTVLVSTRATFIRMRGPCVDLFGIRTLITHTRHLRKLRRIPLMILVARACNLPDDRKVEQRRMLIS